MVEDFCYVVSFVTSNSSRDEECHVRINKGPQRELILKSVKLNLTSPKKISSMIEI